MFLGETFRYWPSELLTELSAGADSLLWGGKILGSWSRSQDHKGNASKPEMGSGHLPRGGFSRTCYVDGLGLVNQTLEKSVPKSLTFMTTLRERPDVRVGAREVLRG